MPFKTIMTKIPMLMMLEVKVYLLQGLKVVKGSQTVVLLMSKNHVLYLIVHKLWNNTIHKTITIQQLKISYADNS